MENDFNRTGSHIRNVGHIVDLAIKSAFRKDQNSIASARNIAESIRVLVNRRENYEELKGALNLSTANLPGWDTETMWSSTFFVLQGYLKSKAISQRCIQNVQNYLCMLCGQMNEKQSKSSELHYRIAK